MNYMGSYTESEIYGADFISDERAQFLEYIPEGRGSMGVLEVFRGQYCRRENVNVAVPV